MSVAIGYYFNTNQPLQELAETLNGVIGCSLAPYEADCTDYFCRLFSMEFALGHNELESDRDLNFDDYGYSLDVCIPVPDHDLLTIAIPTMMSVAYVLHSRLGIHDGLLVWDVQRAIAKYAMRHGEQSEELWYDTVTERAVTYPDHWSHVLSR